MLLMACILLVTIDAVVSSQVTRQQQYALIKGKRITGHVIINSEISSPFECGALCLKQSCKAYNIMTTAEGISCQIIGNELQQDPTDNPQTDNPQTDCYCK